MRQRASNMADIQPGAAPGGEITGHLKGLAILMVVGIHYFIEVYGNQGTIQWTFEPDFLRQVSYTFALAPAGTVPIFLLHFGYLGVEAFFILSGFGLATSALRGVEAAQRSVSIPYQPFLLRRALRILPLYYLVLLAHLAVVIARNPGQERLIFSLRHLAYKALLVHSYSKYSIASLNSALWFVGVLGVLYALFPVILPLLWRRPLAVSLAAIAISYASSSLIAASALGASQPSLAMNGFPPAKLGSFVLGAGYAVWFAKDPGRVGRAVRSPLALIPLAAAFGAGVLGYKYRLLYPLHPLLLVAPALALLVMLHAWLGSVVRILLAPLGLLGAYSYGVFLIHQPLIAPWLGLAGSAGRSLAGAAVFLCLTALCAAALQWMERRYLRPALARRFTPKPRSEA